MVLHNPNNWHWVDKNCLSWSQTYFNEKLIGVSATEGDLSAEISGISSCEGDVDVSQRKGKVISLFDLRIVLNYKGQTAKADDVTGTITIPEVSYDADEDDFEFQISINSENGDKGPIKPFIRQKLVPQLRKALAKFGPDLIETHGKDIQHPKGHSSEQKTTLPPLAKGASANGPEATTGAPAPSVKGSAAYNTTSLTLDPVFNATAEQLYDAFLKPEMVAAWSRSKPDISADEGREYTLFNGNVSGKITKLVPNKSISQTWRLRDWKPAHYANLNLELDQGAGETTLKVNWTGIPVGQEEVVEQNFDEYYVKPIKITFGFGAVL